MVRLSSTAAESKYDDEFNMNGTEASIGGSLHDWLFQPFTSTRADGIGTGRLISRAVISPRGGAPRLDETTNDGALCGLSVTPAQSHAKL
jgi:nitrogen-specific signal transduction histidine kinase